jgi:hypothetical protein
MYKHPVDPKKSILKIRGEGSSTNITYYSAFIEIKKKVT